MKPMPVRKHRARRRVSMFLKLHKRLGVLWPVIAGFCVLAVLFVAGTAAFMLVEGWDLFDSVYMMIISLTTVGYGEVHPLSREGRVVASLVLLFGVGTFFYLAGAFVQLMVEGHIQNIFGRRWMRQSIERMRGHTIVCGYGRIGAIVAREIIGEGHDVVVIERSHTLIEELEQKDVPFVSGDATKDDILLAAGLNNAKALVSALSDEAANVYVTLTARQMNPEIYIVARSDSPDHSHRLTRAGANQVLFPHLYGGMRMAQSVLRPTVTGFMDLAMRGDIEDLQMEQLTLSQESPVAGKDLIAAQLRQRFNIIVIGIKKTDGKLLFNPQPQVVMEAGDTLILVGGKQNLIAMQQEIV